MIILSDLLKVIGHKYWADMVFVQDYLSRKNPDSLSAETSLSDNKEYLVIARACLLKILELKVKISK